MGGLDRGGGLGGGGLKLACKVCVQALLHVFLEFFTHRAQKTLPVYNYSVMNISYDDEGA